MLSKNPGQKREQAEVGVGRAGVVLGHGEVSAGAEQLP
jgi:hypothetical protein